MAYSSGNESSGRVTSPSLGPFTNPDFLISFENVRPDGNYTAEEPSLLDTSDNSTIHPHDLDAESISPWAYSAFIPPQLHELDGSDLLLEPLGGMVRVVPVSELDSSQVYELPSEVSVAGLRQVETVEIEDVDWPEVELKLVTSQDDSACADDPWPLFDDDKPVRYMKMQDLKSKKLEEPIQSLDRSSEYSFAQGDDAFAQQLSAPSDKRNDGAAKTEQAKSNQMDLDNPADNATDASLPTSSSQAPQANFASPGEEVFAQRMGDVTRDKRSGYPVYPTRVSGSLADFGSVSTFSPVTECTSYLFPDVSSKPSTSSTPESNMTDSGESAKPSTQAILEATRNALQDASSTMDTVSVSLAASRGALKARGSSSNASEIELPKSPDAEQTVEAEDVFLETAMKEQRSAREAESSRDYFLELALEMLGLLDKYKLREGIFRDRNVPSGHAGSSNSASIDGNVKVGSTRTEPQHVRSLRSLCVDVVAANIAIGSPIKGSPSSPLTSIRPAPCEYPPGHDSARLLHQPASPEREDDAVVVVSSPLRSECRRLPTVPLPPPPPPPPTPAAVMAVTPASLPSGLVIWLKDMSKAYSPMWRPSWRGLDDGVTDEAFDRLLVAWPQRIRRTIVQCWTDGLALGDTVQVLRQKENWRFVYEESSAKGKGKGKDKGKKELDALVVVARYIMRVGLWTAGPHVDGLEYFRRHEELVAKKKNR